MFFHQNFFCTIFDRLDNVSTLENREHRKYLTKLYRNISSKSITILLCHLIRNTCPFITYYFAKYYYNDFS